MWSSYNKFNPEIYAGKSCVNEIILRERERKLVVDIDSKPDIDEIRKYFTGLYGKTIIWETTKGYHVAVDLIVDFEKHRALIAKTDKDDQRCNVVDLIAGLNSIKLVGTKSKSLESICKWSLDAVVDALSPSTKMSRWNTLRKIIPVWGVSDKDLAAISMALTGEPDQITGQVSVGGNRLTLAGRPSHYCNICQRRHGYNAMLDYVEVNCDNSLVYEYEDHYDVICPRCRGKR